MKTKILVIPIIVFILISGCVEKTVEDQAEEIKTVEDQAEEITKEDVVFPELPERSIRPPEEINDSIERRGFTGEVDDSVDKDDSVKCPDGVWDDAEQADPTLCPEDNPDKTGIKEDVVSSSSDTEIEVDVVYRIKDISKPGWAANFQGNNPPWEGSIYLAESEDGMSFTNEKLFVDHAGVPNLLLTGDNKLIAAFQYFSYEVEELFGFIAYTVSEDFGETWSPVKNIKFEGIQIDDKGGQTPVDPTLVELENGSLRLYFTYHVPGKQYPELYSAISESVDGVFRSEGGQLETNEMILDPAVAYFKDGWHHYTVRHGSGRGGSYSNVHSVSDDGLDFKLQDDISMEFSFLGDVIEDEGVLRFYGTGNGVVLATSMDGYSWTKLKERVSDGADPGVAKLPNGSYLIVYTR